MRLALQTWPRVEEYLTRRAAILIPIGSTEQHGPSGLIGTDHLTAEMVADRVGERLGILVGPTIPVGMALHHMAFPGTISLKPETLMAVLRDYVGRLYRHGFRQFFFINGHGGNVATARAAFSAMREELPEAELLWANWYDRPAVSRLIRELFGDRDGEHATPSEISVTMVSYPEHVTPIREAMDIESCRPRGIPGSDEFRKLYPDGRMGSDPSLARREHGERILDASVSALAAEAKAILERAERAQR